MKHPATTRSLETMRQTAATLLSELCARTHEVIDRLRPLQPPVEAAVTIDLDNILALDGAHGFGSADHAVRLMARALEEETSPDDFVARTGETTFAVVIRGADRTAALAMVDRVHARFDELLFDAGYECDLSLGETPVVTAPEVDEMLDRNSLPQITPLPAGVVFLN